jgi:hypothetical protein
MKITEEGRDEFHGLSPSKRGASRDARFVRAPVLASSALTQEHY